MERLHEQTKDVNDYLARYGVRFGIYKGGRFVEQLFPFDAIPRILPADEFSVMERGLIQRVTALNLFLSDIYQDRCILRDKIIPEEFVFSSKGYLAQCIGIRPTKGIYSHISGIDLVQAKDGNWYILEDNLRVPSGASYPMVARNITRSVSPETFEETPVVENRDYSQMLTTMMNQVNCGGINVILTPGRYNSAFFEHSYLAEMTGAVLAFPDDLQVIDSNLYYKSYTGKKERVGTLYRRISDEYLDPMIFEQHSVIGIPHLMDAYRKGNVAIVNAPGNGVADDKGIYYFVPKMISYYLHEEPILNNAITYLPSDPKDAQYIQEHLETLVLKDVSEAGGYGIVFGKDLDKTELAQWRLRLKHESRRFIAQEVIDFVDLDVLDDDGKIVPRKADLRAFVVNGDNIQVWKSGLTRFSRVPESFVVNSSQGGGFKDTWVLSQK